MSWHRTSQSARSVAAYGVLLYLYPDRFRRAFGPGMREAFGQMVEERGAADAWKAVGGELVPSLVREHVSDAGERLSEATIRAGALLRPLRVLLAVAGPALAYAWVVRHSTRAEEVAAVTLWFAAVAVGLARTRGRGWAGAGWAVAGGVLVAAGLIVRDTVAGSSDILSVAPLLLALSGLAAFTVASYVRVFVEGVQLGELGWRVARAT